MEVKELKDMFEDNNLLENRLNVIMYENFFLINKPKENKLKEYIEILNDKIVESIYDGYKYIDNDKKYYKKELNIDEMKKVLLKRIPVLFKEYLDESITKEEAIIFKDNINNNKSLTKNISLLNLGFIYEIKEKNEKVYIVPEELKEIYTNTYTNEKLEEILYKKIDTYFPVYLTINGILPQDFIEDVIIKHYKLEITKDKLREYLSKKVRVYKEYYSIFEDKEEFINEEIIPLKQNKEYKVINEYELLMYSTYISNVIEEIKNIIKTNEPEDNVNLYMVISTSGITTEEIVESINSGYNLTKNKLDKLTKLIDREINELILFSTNGYTIYEYKKNKLIERNLMKDKPDDNSFNSLIKLVDKDILKELCKKYDTTSERLLELVKNKFLDYLKSLDEEELYFLENNYYSDNINTIDIDDIENGYIFVYKDNNEIKYIIPTEIQDILNNFLEEFSNDDVIYLVLEYICINGVIEIQKLLEILNNNHYISISYSELITILDELAIKRIGRYCTIVNDLTLRDIEEYIKTKKEIGYKIVDLNNLDKFNIMLEKLKEYLSKTNYSEENIKILIENAVTAVRHAA